jgi:hypothetical protein
VKGKQMSFDISRATFDPWKDYLGVVMQQGRVQLDSDWNEFQAEFLRRLQAGTLDILGQDCPGQAIWPPSTPDGFNICGPVIVGPAKLRPESTSLGRYASGTF